MWMGLCTELIRSQGLGSSPLLQVSQAGSISIFVPFLRMPFYFLRINTSCDSRIRGSLIQKLKTRRYATSGAAQSKLKTTVKEYV